jgi:hypothetical protein
VQRLILEAENPKDGGCEVGVGAGHGVAHAGAEIRSGGNKGVVHVGGGERGVGAPFCGAGRRIIAPDQAGRPGGALFPGPAEGNDDIWRLRRIEVNGGQSKGALDRLARKDHARPVPRLRPTGHAAAGVRVRAADVEEYRAAIAYDQNLAGLQAAGGGAGGIKPGSG